MLLCIGRFIYLFLCFQFLWIHSQKWTVTSSIFNFWGAFILFSTVAVPVYNTHRPQECTRVPFPLHPYQHLLSFVFWMMAILTGMRWYLIVVLICISLMTRSVEHLFIYLLPICVSFFEKWLLGFLLIFKLGDFSAIELCALFIWFGY